MATVGTDRGRSSVARGLLLLAIANLRREKTRSGLIVITVALATLMFTTALGSLGGLGGPIEAMMTRLHASHLMMSIDSRVYDPSEVVEWWRGRAHTVDVSPLLATVVMDTHPVHHGHLMSDLFRLTERPGRAATQNLLEIVEGEDLPNPGPGELWVPTSLARSESLEVGDVVEIPTDQGVLPYTVSGVVVDPQYSNGFTNPVRVWVAPGELAGLFPAARLHTYTLGVRLDDPAAARAEWSEFDSGFPGGFSGSSTSFDEMVGAYSMLIQMMSVLVLAFGVLSLLVALFIISSTISGEILANYRIFGVLKSMGYTPRNVIGIFQVQFILLSLVAIPIGIAGGDATARSLIRLMLQSIGRVETELHLAGPAVLTFVLLLGLVSVTAGGAGARAGRIRAASSIRFGAPEEALRMRVPIHLRAARYLPLPLVIGLKQAVSGRKRELYDLVTVAATAFVLFFSVNLLYSMTVVGRNLPFWGFDGSDVAVKLGDTSFAMGYESVKDYLAMQPGVMTVGGTSITDTVIVPEQNGTMARQISGHVVDGDLDALGFINLRGRNPDRPLEVALGVTTARDFGVDVGDDIDLSVRGQTMSFQVTAVFQGSSNSGNWYRMTIDSFRLADPTFEPEQIAVLLGDGVDRTAFMHDIEAQLGDAVDLEPAEKFVESQVNQLVGLVGMVLAFLSVVFMVVSAVSIFNSTAMGIHESKRQLGVFKALGYTRAQIRMILVSKSGVLAAASVVAGIVLFCLLAGRIIDALTARIGMPEFPMTVQPLWSSIAIPVIIGLCMVSSWIPSNRIANISARTLIVE